MLRGQQRPRPKAAEPQHHPILGVLCPYTLLAQNDYIWQVTHVGRGMFLGVSCASDLNAPALPNFLVPSLYAYALRSTIYMW